MGKYIDFVKQTDEKGNSYYQIINKENIHLGDIVKIQVGAWQSWVLMGVPEPDIYFSAGCQDDIRAFCKHLGGFAKSKDKKFIYSSLSDLRDALYEELPTGEVDAFQLIKVIKEHIQELDNLLELLK